MSAAGPLPATEQETSSVEETLELGARLAERLGPGAVVHLHGDLGTGKTHLVKGLARGLGLDPDEVRSPTFTLVDVHEAARDASLGLVHVDLYRVESPEELSELGLDELPGRGAVAAVEWADRLAAPDPSAWQVTLTDLGGDRRRVEVAPPSAPARGRIG